MTPDRPEPHPLKDSPGPEAEQPYLPALLVPLLLGLYLVLTSTADLVPGIGEYDEKRLIGIFLLLSLALLALLLAPLRAGVARQARRAPRWFWLALGTALLLAATSALRFPLPGYGLAEPAMLALIITGTLIVAASRQLTGALFDRFAMLIVAALGLGVAMQEWAGIAANWALGLEFEYQNMLVRFSHPRFYNHLQTWSVPVLAALPFLFGGSRRLKAAAIALLALQWCILLVSGSRGSTLSIVLALTLTAFLRSRGRFAWLQLHLAGLLLGWALYGGLILGQSHFAQQGGRFMEQSIGRPMLHTTGRFEMWRTAWREAQSSPWLGVGPARFQCEAGPGSPAHPHNIFFQTLAEWGFPATLLMLSAVGFLIVNFLRPGRWPPPTPDAHSQLTSMLWASMAAACVHLNLSGLLMAPGSQVMAALMSGWLLGSTNFPSAKRRRPPGWVALSLAGACLLAIGLAWFATTGHSVLREHEIVGKDIGPAMPRFWQHGRICLYPHHLHDKK